MLIGCFARCIIIDESAGPDVTSEIAKKSNEDEKRRMLLFMLLTGLVSMNKFTSFYCVRPLLFIHQKENDCALLAISCE